jgi:hypothetical protein
MPLAPGERRTIVIVWHRDDPAKQGDSRYFISAEYAAMVKRVDPNAPDMTGWPRGMPLSSFLADADDDGAVDLTVPFEVEGAGKPPPGPKLSLLPFSDDDPERTYLSISREFVPTTPPEPVRSSDDGIPLSKLSAFDPERAIEVEPGLFVQDERRSE